MKQIICFMGVVAAILAVSFPAAALPINPYDVDANTIALYHLDGFDGSNITPDAVGFHPGTVFGNTSVASGKFGNALSFDGNGDYVRIGNVHKDPVSITSTGTVEAWVNLSNIPSGNMVILGSGTEYGSSWDDGYYLGKYGSEDLIFMIWTGGWQIAHSWVDLDDLLGGWHHVAGTWGPDGVEVWVDGELKGNNPYTGGLPNPDYSTALIGTDSWTWATPGLIDEVRISDIQRNFVATAVPVPPAFLLLGSGLAAIGGLRRKFLS